jgi:hypothetical protein
LLGAIVQHFDCACPEVEDDHRGAKHLALDLHIRLIGLDRYQLFVNAALNQESAAAVWKNHIVKQARGDEERKVAAAQGHERPHRAILRWPDLLAKRGLDPHSTAASF